ncbi:MAG: hypothetical protein ABI091_10910, partial [Ferruginibacter sp.]
MKNIKYLLFILFLQIVYTASFSQIKYPRNPPGNAKAFLSSQQIILENNVAKMIFKIKQHQIHPVSFTDKVNHRTIDLLLLNWFELSMHNGKIISDKDFHFLNNPIIKTIAKNEKSAK